MVKNCLFLLRESVSSKPVPVTRDGQALVIHIAIVFQKPFNVQIYRTELKWLIGCNKYEGK